MCSVTDCPKPVKSRGLCTAHYHRLRRYGDPTFVPSQSKLQRATNHDPSTGERLPCRFDGCGNLAMVDGLCKTHDRRLKLYGDPSITLRPYRQYRRVMSSGYVGVYVPGHPLAGKNGYALEHRYVLYEAGVDIEGMHVHHLDHDKTNNDPNNLAVMTPGEHAEHHGSYWNAGQFQRQETCGRGHEFTPENTYWYTCGRGKQHRECYTCKRARSRKAAS